jgi:hypothetical protein
MPAACSRAVHPLIPAPGGRDCPECLPQRLADVVGPMAGGPHTSDNKDRAAPHGPR